MSERVIVVILAYGLWGTSKRSPKEIVGYGMYLKECTNALRHLVACDFDVKAILCGGATANGMTEAESMLEYFKPLAEECELTLEDRSLTTPANIWQAYEKMEKYASKSEIPNHQVLFLCDAARELKVRWLINKWQSQACKTGSSITSWPKAEVLGFNRPDIKVLKSTKIFQLFEVLAMMLIPTILNRRINKLRQ